jgi:hypothetical protein
LQLIAAEDHAVGLGKNVREVFNAVDRVDLGQDLDIASAVAKDVSDLLDVVSGRGKGNHEEIDIDKPRDGLQVLVILDIQQRQVLVLAADKPDLGVGP